MTTRRIVYQVTLRALAEVPGSPFAYWAPKRLRDLFRQFPPLDRDVAQQPDKPKVADVKVGLQTSDDLRFTRYWWEVPIAQIAGTQPQTGQGMKWVPLAVGQWLDKFRMDLDTVVNWGNNGQEIKSYRDPAGRLLSRPQNASFYFRDGLAWNASVQMRQLPRMMRGGAVPFYALPKGAIFSAAHHALFLDDGTHWHLLDIICSKLYLACSRLFTMDKVGMGVVARLPIMETTITGGSGPSLSHEAHDLLREWDTGNEVSTQFIVPWMLLVLDAANDAWDEATLKPLTRHPLADDFEWSNWESAKRVRSLAPGEALKNRVSSSALAQVCAERGLLLRKRLGQIQRQIDDEVYRLYDISEEDRALIEAELGQPLDEAWDEASDQAEPEEEAPIEEVMPAEEHIKRLIHYLAHQSIKDDVDGIVPLYDTYKAGGFLERGLAHRVRDGLQGIFGEVAPPAVEEELRSALGVPLGDWIESELFNYHVGLYRWRPIIWEIASRSRGQPGFGCFVYWHKLDADTLRKVREVYLRPAVDTAQREAGRLASELARRQAADEPLATLRQTEKAWRDAQARADELGQLSERIQSLLQSHRLSVESRSSWVPEKVNEIVAQGYRPNRDYGVRVNIEPLKQAGILAAAANRVKG